MEYARKNTGRIEIHGDIDGIAVLNSLWRVYRWAVQEGDEVRGGSFYTDRESENDAMNA
jgi:hypothetical protein